MGCRGQMATFVRAIDEENGGNRVSFQWEQKHTWQPNAWLLHLQSEWAPGKANQTEITGCLVQDQHTLKHAYSNKIYEANLIESNLVQHWLLKLPCLFFLNSFNGLGYKQRSGQNWVCRNTQSAASIFDCCCRFTVICQQKSTSNMNSDSNISTIRLFEM